MTFNFTFRSAESKKDIDILTGFILKQPLNYKNYFDWIERAREELLIGYKKSVMAFYYDVLVGDLIFQPHKSIKKFREIKHGRTLGEYQRRLILSFMIRQAEHEARKEGDLATICDARSDRLDVQRLLLVNGYKEIARADLYKEGYEDIVLMKPLVNDERKSWLLAA